MAGTIVDAPPFFLYDNLLADGTLSVTSPGSVSAGALANLTDGLLFTTVSISGTGGTNLIIECDLGSGNTQKADTLAMTGQDFWTNSANPSQMMDLDVEYSDNGSSWTSVNFGTVGARITSDRTIVIPFTSDAAAHRYWRVTLTDNGHLSWSTDPTLATMCLGQRLDFTEYMATGFDPDALSLDFEQNRGRDGGFLGSVVGSIRQSMQVRFPSAGVARTFIFSETDDIQGYRADLPSWPDFLRRIWTLGKPWWFAWHTWAETGNLYYSPEGRWFCMPSTKASVRAPYISSQRRGLSISFDVMVEGYMGDTRTVGANL